MSADKTTKCKRCNGAGHTDVDILPGIPHEPCNRCNGCGNEPTYLRSWAAWEIEFRRQATANSVPLDFQDGIVAMVTRGKLGREDHFGINAND